MKTNPELWQKLKSFQVDSDAAAFPFSQRLARDNQWSHAYALEVIKEYKRFVYLAMVAGFEVTPSDEVDQVWHLHLTYTHSYWGAFQEILEEPLHHGPTQGGGAEKIRYWQNYARTLQGYTDEFGVTPPSRIWPSPQDRFARAPKMQRLYVDDYLMVPKRVLQRFLYGAIASVTAACAFVATSFAASVTGVAGGRSDLLIGIGALILLGAVVLMVTSKGRRRSGRDKSGGGGLAGGSGGGGKSSDADGGGDGGSGCSGCGGCGG